MMKHIITKIIDNNKHYIHTIKAKIAIFEDNRHVVNYVIYLNSLLVALLAGMIFMLNQTEIQKYMDIRQNISQMKEISESYELILTKAQVTLQPETENLKKLALSLNQKKDNITVLNDAIDDENYTHTMRSFVNILDKRFSARQELIDLYYNLAKIYRDYHIIAQNAEKALGDNMPLQLKVKHIMLSLEGLRLMSAKNNRDAILKNIHSLRNVLLNEPPYTQAKLALFGERTEDIVHLLRYIDTIRMSMRNDGYDTQLKKIEIHTYDKMNTEKMIFKGKLFLLFVIGGILITCQMIILSWFFIYKRKTDRVYAEATQIMQKSKSIVTRAKQYALEAQREQYKLLKNFCEDFSYILSSISHISKSIYVHSQSEENDTHKHGLQTLCASIEALEKWLHNYLTIHTAQDEWREVKNEVFHIGDVVDSVFSQARFYASTREHQMALYYAEIPKKFIGDAEYIMNIYMNMVYIILKWSQNSPFKTVVDYIPKQDEDSTDTLVIEVSDTSSDDDFIVRNDLFNHEDNDNTQYSSLEDRFISASLYFARQISEVLGASLTLSRDNETKENSLRIDIPISVYQEDTKESPLGVPILRNKKALIVSPYPNILQTFEKQLTLYGMKVSAIHDHYAAIGYIIGTQQSGESFDIIILDHHLPDIDATSLIKIIRENTILGLVHIIVITTETFLPMLEDSKHHIDKIMTKPVRPDMLYENLEKFISLQLYGNVVEDVIEDDNTKRFLAIMNEDLSSSLLKLILTRQNYHIDIATTVLQIMEALDRNIYDFVIISNKGTWIVPENIIKDIRRHHTDNKNTVMILVYDEIKKPYQKKLIKAGFDDFIPLPFDKNYFLNKILEWDNPTTRRLSRTLSDIPLDNTEQKNNLNY